MTFTTQAIETKYLGPTNFRGERIKARAWAGSVTVPYDSALNADANHRAAADALRAKYGWEGTFAQGGNAAGSGYVFVNVEGA
jgi:hypothetical protein